MSLLLRLATAAMVGLLHASLAVPNAHAQVTIDWVTVGNPGNANDTTGYGAVNYEYKIGKYEVTIGQYTEFLNAVAKSDTYGLWQPAMATSLTIAGVMRTGSSGAYNYSVMNNNGSSANRPITYVDWFDAARFSNWLANGQLTGAQDATTTENGAYDLSASTFGSAVPLNTVNPNTGSKPTYYIPTENEWYKAAFYDPTLNSGTGGYWRYATRSNAPPGNTIGGESNQANYMYNLVFAVTQSPNYSAAQNYLTDVGAFTNSASYYGTFDQSGGLYEWNDKDRNEALGNIRGVRGGNWGSNLEIYISSEYFSDVGTGTDGYPSYGIRLAAPAAVPEPSTYAMALAGLACSGFSMWRCRKRA